MNQHLFRHLSALIYLRRHPSNHIAVQHLLGHKSLKTTMEYYCGPEIDALADHIMASLGTMKAEMGLEPSDMSCVIEQTQTTTKSKICTLRSKVVSATKLPVHV